MRALARLLVVALAGTRVADTKFVRGKLDTIQSWKYITRFCFTGMPQSARCSSATNHRLRISCNAANANAPHATPSF